MTDGEWDISAGSVQELQEKLSEHYDVEEIWYSGDFHHDGEMHMDVLTYWDGEWEHFITDGVPVYGHGPSGAVGVYKDDLPSKEKVNSVVESVESSEENDE